jgi:hypothetical protein
VSKVVRRSLFVAVLALIAVPFTAIGSSAQEIPNDLTITVRKVVVGTGTGPSSITLDCVGNPEQPAALDVGVLNFDAQGNPTTGSLGFEKVDGAWVVNGRNGAGGHCTFTETSTGGASSTAWTCTYDFEAVIVPEAAQVEQGCSAASGDGVGPIEVEYPGDDVVASQSSTVVFTNTFTAAPLEPLRPAAQVVAQPAFTG